MVTSEQRRRSYEYLGLALVVALGVCFRVPYITERSLWFDEGSSWRTATFRPSALAESLRQSVHPPFYYLLLKGWMATFGESLIALRSLSILLGCGTIVTMYLFGRELYRSSAGCEEGSNAEQARCSCRAGRFALFLAALVAVSPCQVQSAIEARMYSLGTLSVALMSWLLLRAIRVGNTWKLWIAYGTCAVAFLHTHNYAILSIAAQFVFLIFCCLRFIRGGQAARAHALLGWSTIAAVLMLVFYLPWSVALFKQIENVHRSYWIEPLTLWAIPSTLVELLIPEYLSRYPSELAILATTLMTAAVLGVTAWRPRLGNALVILSATLPMVFAAGFSLWTPIWEARYFRFAQLFFLTALALVVWRLATGWSRVFLAGLLLANFAALSATFWTVMDVPHRPGMRGAIERVVAHSRNPGVIVTTTASCFLPAKFYAGSEIDVYLLEFSEGLTRQHPAITRDDVISEQRLVSLNGGIWLIADSPRAEVIRLLKGHRLVEEFRLADCYSFQPEIWVAHYVRHQGEEAPEQSEAQEHWRN